MGFFLPSNNTIRCQIIRKEEEFSYFLLEHNSTLADHCFVFLIPLLFIRRFVLDAASAQSQSGLSCTLAISLQIAQ